VIEYRLQGVDEADSIYRLVTTLFDPAQAPAAGLAALYHEHWEALQVDQHREGSQRSQV